MKARHNTGASMNRGFSKQDHPTPRNFIQAVEARFGPINFDLAAHSKNTKHANYFNRRDDSLRQEWHKIPGILWLNPEFDNIAPWAAKCAEEMYRGAHILFLTPASVGSNWFADYVHRKAFVLGLQGRLSFDGIAPYPKDCTLSIFHRGINGFDTWNWKQSIPRK